MSGIMRNGEGCQSERETTGKLTKSPWCGSAWMPVSLPDSLACPYQKIARSWAWRNKRLVESLSLMIRNNSLAVPSPKTPTYTFMNVWMSATQKASRASQRGLQMETSQERRLGVSLHPFFLSSTLEALCLWEMKEGENASTKSQQALL